MLQGLTLPLVAKICAAAVVTGGAGVVTYQVVDVADDEPTVVVVDDSTSEPDILAFDDEEKHDEEPDESVKADEPTAGEPEGEKPNEATSEKNEGESEKKDEVADVEGPEIVILSPKAESHHDDKSIVFEGETEPGAKVTAGPYPATVDDEGNWRIELILSPGANRAKIAATDAAGNVSYATVTVYLDVEEKAEEKKEDDKDQDKDQDKDEVGQVEFSAKQKYGWCDDLEPYDVFWGTATPNTLVQITSPYGNATVEVNKSGHWEKKVYFENAPLDQGFVVTVSAANGSKSFEFVAKTPPAENDPEHSDESK